MFEIERLGLSEDEVGESPRWDVDEQALYWLDIWTNPTVHRLEPRTGAYKKWSPGILVTGVARRKGGGFVFASRSGLYLWDEETGEQTFLGDPEGDNPNVRFNDGSACCMDTGCVTGSTLRLWAARRSLRDLIRSRPYNKTAVKITPANTTAPMAIGPRYFARIACIPVGAWTTVMITVVPMLALLIPNESTASTTRVCSPLSL